MAEHLLVGTVTNGEYTKTQTSQDTTKANETTSTSKSEAKRDTGYNKDMFLQLLVAEMQYQDPLQPSDNSQYVAQLASFTQIEAMQSVQDNMDTIQSNSIVGKVVALNVDGEEITGRVDFTTKDDEKGTMLSVDGELYEMSKMISVIDEDYYNAKYMASLLTDAIKNLPDAEQITIKDEKLVTEAVGIFNAMDDYDRSFVDEKALKKYVEAVNQFYALKEAMEATDNTSEDVPEAEEAAGAGTVTQTEEEQTTDEATVNSPVVSEAIGSETTEENSEETNPLTEGAVEV